MPRSHWKGSISFGLVSIPISLYNSVDPSSGVSFKQINLKTGAPIKYKRVDTETEKEVPWENIGRGYKYSKDVILPVKEDELKRVAGENAKTIAIDQFIDKKNIDFVHVEHTYYLVPEKKGEKGYIILREALKDSNKVGIAKVIISTKEYLAAVAPLENALVLYLLHYNEEIRKLSEFELPSEDLKKYKITNNEIVIAKKLIQSMSGKWRPEKYKDEYKEAVEKWVDQKIHHLPLTKMKSRSHAKPATNVVNFVDLLKKSLQTEKKAQSEHKVSGKHQRKSTQHKRATTH